jgi:hypothetical protein
MSSKAVRVRSVGSLSNCKTRKDKEPPTRHRGVCQHEVDPRARPRSYVRSLRASSPHLAPRSQPQERACPACYNS